MPDILRCCFSFAKLFTMNNIRSKVVQWIVVLILLLLGYVMIYNQSAVLNFKSFFNLVWANKNSRRLSIFQFRKYLADSSIGSLNINFSSSHRNTTLCPIIPPGLVGSIIINRDILSYKTIEDNNRELQPGGCYSPSNCTPRHHVAILIPYRDRQSHLKLFLQNIHPFLRKQQLDYGIFVIELVSDVKFNRAMLFNIGFVEALKLHNYNCFIFHDVDLIPENDLNLYTCAERPRHMSVAIDKMKYRLPYNQLFGGVSAMTKEQFETVNGFSNSYFGWGGEDDDMYNRIAHNKMSIIRYSSEVARYKMMSHAKEAPNPVRGTLLKDGQKRFKIDGLNSLQYEVLQITRRKLFTWILVNINEKAVKDAIEVAMKL
ncbi:beta-1,4-N-acetylgalactosaminyltransferase bre-4 [Patella vulgata]|uniref:beta-1,4-N-acetylgalactosaminyltransferase bre-4 n=1 Tax=Patella vulgata TaxID=6465 RepID=UPI0021809BC7|nr:beta-1,4-N-acetylgalactosaminyltransferase bre-4 [Patella vulgata]